MVRVLALHRCLPGSIRAIEEISLMSSWVLHSIIVIVIVISIIIIIIVTTIPLLNLLIVVIIRLVIFFVSPLASEKTKAQLV